jgi:DNA polymerase (family 10)
MRTVRASSQTKPPHGQPARAIPSVNRRVAEAFDRIATLLAANDGSEHRVAAYRRAAATLRQTQRDVASIHGDGGVFALTSIPTIGRALAAEIEDYIVSGRLRLLDRLEERCCPRLMLADLPGIGATLARRIVEELGVETLEDLEVVAHDGRLAGVQGFGRRRLHTTKRALAERLRRHPPAPPAPAPPVPLLLELDGCYRRRATAGTLHKIAPRRFNPHGVSWLPVMTTEREGWRFNIMYSNTARAHQLGKTKDWVVFAFEHEGREGHATIVTEHRGPDVYHRVVRGRERECHEHYQRHPVRPTRLPMAGTSHALFSA